MRDPRCSCVDTDEIGLVDEHARQRIRIELDLPAAIGRAALTTISGMIAFRDPGLEAAAGLGIELADFGQHVDQVFLVNAADALEGGEIAPGQQLEVADERLHGRIEAILLTQLDRKTFRQIASKNAGRIERLQ